MLNENDIQKQVLEKIHVGGISMHSRTYFIVRAVLIGIGAVLVLACALFALSFVFFSVHQSGVRFLLEFGNQGLVTFVTLFPWTSLLLAIAFLIALELVVRHFTSAYRFSLLRIFLWVLVIGIMGSTLIGFTPFHSFLLSAADNNQLPVLGPLYEQVRVPHHERGVYRGNITSVTASDFVIAHSDTDRDSDEGSWTIVPPAGFATSTLVIGTKVYVAGRLQHGIIYAYGIRFLQNKQ